MTKARLSGTVTDDSLAGIPIAGALVYVYKSGGLAALQDSLGQAIGNPVTTDEEGYWEAWADTDLFYDLHYYWGGRKRGIETNKLLGTAGFSTDPNIRTDLAAADGAGLMGFLQSGTGAVARTVEGKARERRSVIDYATSAQAASFEAFDGEESAQAPLDYANTAAQADDGQVVLPAGKFPVTQVLIPADNSEDNRGRYFSITGSGTGEPFVISDASRKGTVFVGTDNTLSVLKTRVKSGGAASESAGGVHFENFRVEHDGDAGVPAIDLTTFYGPNVMRRVDVYQQGAGDGIHVGYMATGKIEMCYILGPAWVDGVGASGTGLKLDAAASAGLQTIEKVSSRGFATAFQIGATGGLSLLAPSLTDCEVSYCTGGVVITNACKSAGLTRLYVEGTTGTAISDAGFASYISDTFAELAFTTGVNMAGQGGVVSGGYFGLKPTGATGVKITAAGSLYGATVKAAHFRWGGNDGTNVAVGIEIQAASNPRATLIGNTFEPAGQWFGAGSKKIKDSSYSADHGGSGQANGSGVFGYMQREDGSFVVIPALSRGAINLHVDGQILSEPYIDVSGTLALSAASVQYLELATAKAVNRFTAPNLPDKTGKLIVNNGNLTLSPSAYILGIARAIQLPAGKAAWFEYQVLLGSVAPISITNIHLYDTHYTVAELATLKGDFSQTIIASNGLRSGETTGAGSGCPVWWDGTNWRTFYDNSVVAS